MSNPIKINNIKNYTFEIIDDTLILTPKKTMKIKNKYTTHSSNEYEYEYSNDYNDGPTDTSSDEDDNDNHYLNLIDEFKNGKCGKDALQLVNYNGMNLFEILTDISKVVNVDVFSDKMMLDHMNGLLGSIPRHSNLYYIVCKYKKMIPRWFADKYSDKEKERWDEYIMEN